MLAGLLLENASKEANQFQRKVMQMFEIVIAIFLLGFAVAMFQVFLALLLALIENWKTVLGIALVIYGFMYFTHIGG